MNKRNRWVLITIIIVLAAIFFWFKGIKTVVESRILKSDEVKLETRVFPSPQDTIYRMALKLDAISLVLSGHSIISTINTTQQDLTELWVTTYPNALYRQETTPAPAVAYYHGFNPGWMSVATVSVNGQPATYSNLGLSGRITLAKPVKPGEELTIDMVWQDKIPQVAYRYGSREGVILLGHCYPFLNVLDEDGWHLSRNSDFGDPFYLQCADFLVQLTMPENLKVATTGSIVKVEAEDTGQQIIMIKAEKVRDFALAVFSGYQTIEARVDGILLKCHCRPEVAKNGSDILERAAAALKYYGCTYGSYPYPELELIQAPMKGFQGMEYSNLIFLADEVFQPSFGEQKRSFLIAHEVAHQWWFGLVGNDQMEEPWLDEGLASWSANQYLKQVEFRDPSGKGRPPTTLDKSLSQIDTKQAYLDTAYRGGEAFWYGLEQQLGEEKVLGVLRRYLASYKYRTASTEDLRQVIIKEARKDLTPFFQEWFQVVHSE